MFVRDESDLMRLWRATNKLYLATLEDEEVNNKSLVAPNTLSMVCAESDKTKVVLINEDNEILYIFGLLLNEGECYKVEL